MNFEELMDAVKEEEVTLDLDDGQVQLSSSAEGGILAAVYLGEIPEETLSKFCRQMLAANHLFLDTAGATLSLEPGTHDAFLQRWYRGAVEGEETFLNHLAALVQKAEEWKVRLSSSEYEPGSVEPRWDGPSADDELAGNSFFMRV